LNALVQHQLETVDWSAQRVIAGRSGADVPAAVERLLAASSDDEAEAAYWLLDNRVVVQGQLFQAALPLVDVLLAALAGPLPPIARVYVADLLVEIAKGVPDESELARGNGTLEDDVRRAARAGLWLIYSLCLDGDTRLRERGLFIADAIDADRGRFGRLLANALRDPEKSVRAIAAELARADATHDAGSSGSTGQSAAT
jgi:hypothetical protein